MFFNKRKQEKQHRIIRFSDVVSMVMETEGMHFELLPGEHVVKYKNVISSKDGVRRFPDGYFEERTSHISYHTMGRISTAFERLFTNLTPEDHLDYLPPGCSRNAYMRVSLSSGNTVYYTDTHAVGDGFQIRVDPVAKEFKKLIQILKPFCSFPKYVPMGIPEKQSPKQQNTIHAKIESDEINRLIGYRFDATGVFGYAYYINGDHVCSVSSIIAPSSSVMIYGNGVTWKSDFENCTIFPGLTRSIHDESNGTQLYQIVYKDRGKYEINQSITAYCETGKYIFCCDDKVIAEIIRVSGKSGFFKNPSDTVYHYEPYFEVSAKDRIDTGLLTVILAFPMLQFGF